MSDRVGQIRLREFRTVDASRMLKAIADEHDLSKTTLQHIKSVLNAVFTHAKNEGAFDGVNPVQDTRFPRNAREARETFAYNLTQIRSILNVLPLLPKAAIATASFAGLREGELRGLEWPDFAGHSLTVNRSIWKKRCESTEDTSQRPSGTRHSATGGNSEHLSSFHGKPASRCDISLRRRSTHGLR